MSARQQFSATWIRDFERPPEVDDGPDYMTVVYDSCDVAMFSARSGAGEGPQPDWWEVRELKRRDSRSISRPDQWKCIHTWSQSEARKQALEAN